MSAVTMAPRTEDALDHAPPSTAARRAALVIGPAALAEAATRCLPDWTVRGARHALDGLWQLGRQRFDGVLVAVRTGKMRVVVRSLRRVAAGLPIVVVCGPTDEPAGRQALDDGADEYVLEPLERSELERALRVPAPVDVESTPLPAALPFEDVQRLGDVLRRLESGLPAVLDRLVRLIQTAFDARGAALKFEAHSAQHGDVSDLILEQAIQRGPQRVGTIALARRVSGPYPAGAGRRLAEWAGLIEACAGQAEALERWRELAFRDDLTSLRNRRYFGYRIDELLELARDRRMRVTLFLFDIDDFKSYNDHQGHECGDALLREVAQLLKQCTRPHDVVARIGGDEFAVVFWDAEKPRVPGSQHPSEAHALSERFRAAIAGHDFRLLGEGRPGPVTISGGLATFPWDGATRDELIRAADVALLTAKRDGKNAIRLAGPIGRADA